MIQRSTCQAGKHGICHPIDTAFDREKSAWGLLAAAYVLGVIGVFFCPLLFCVAGVVYAVITIVKDLPESRDTMALNPATLLKTLGRPEKL